MKRPFFVFEPAHMAWADLEKMGCDQWYDLLLFTWMILPIVAGRTLLQVLAVVVDTTFYNEPRKEYDSGSNQSVCPEMSNPHRFLRPA